jgi:hypothetical protein
MGLLIGLKKIIKSILNFGKAMCPFDSKRKENTEKRVVVF